MATGLDLLEVGSRVNFKIKSNVSLFKKTTFSNMYVEAIISRRSVQNYGGSATRLYNSCLPFLGDGYNVQLDDWKFLVVSSEEDSNTQIIPIEVIDTSTIALTSIKTIVIKISNIDTSESSTIRDILSANGYENFEITIE